MTTTRFAVGVLFKLVVALLPIRADAAQASDAAKIWVAQCASCHGVDGKGNTRLGKKEGVPDFSQAAWQKSLFDAELRQKIAKGSSGNSKMRAYENKLTPVQITQLAAHIRTFGRKKLSAPGPSMQRVEAKR